MIDINEINRRLTQIYFDTNQKIDCICLKSNDINTSVWIYVLEGYPKYEELICDEDRAFIMKIRELGCYGNSETAYCISDNYDHVKRFYVRVNLKSDKQYKQLLDYMCDMLSMNTEQIKILSEIKDCFPVYEGDYLPLYWCGYNRDVDENRYIGLKFYFKCFDVDEKIDLSDVYLKMINKKIILCDNELLDFLQELITNKNARLRLFGIDFDRNGGYRYKIYISFKNSEPFKTIENNFILNNHFLNDILTENKDLNVDLLQLSTDFYKKKCNVSVYFKGPKQEHELYYSLAEGKILREIGGFFFIIDIYNKHYYDIKSLCLVNEIGKVIIEYMIDNKVVNMIGIVSNVKLLIKNYTNEMHDQIFADCEAFVKNLLKKGYIIEV